MYDMIPPEVGHTGLIYYSSVGKTSAGVSCSGSFVWTKARLH